MQIHGFARVQLVSRYYQSVFGKFYTSIVSMIICWWIVTHVRFRCYLRGSTLFIQIDDKIEILELFLYVFLQKFSVIIMIVAIKGLIVMFCLFLADELFVELMEIVYFRKLLFNNFNGRSVWNSGRRKQYWLKISMDIARYDGNRGENKMLRFGKFYQKRSGGHLGSVSMRTLFGVFRFIRTSYCLWCHIFTNHRGVQRRKQDRFWNLHRFFVTGIYRSTYLRIIKSFSPWAMDLWKT